MCNKICLKSKMFSKFSPLLIVVIFYAGAALANSDKGSGISQAAGHANAFLKSNRVGTLLKKTFGNEPTCYKSIERDDPINQFIAKFYGLTRPIKGGDEYIEIQNLLVGFDNPSVMNIKMGTMTFREKDNDEPRSDLYKKMIELDPNEPTLEEKKMEAITKSRYLRWRDLSSSTSSLGFRIEKQNIVGDSTVKDKLFYATLKEPEDILNLLSKFAPSYKLKREFLIRLLDFGMAASASPFFRSHQFVGSSLLFVHDNCNSNIYFIDFSQTYTVPAYKRVTHNRVWQKGNYEDGFFIGLNNLTKMFQKMFEQERDSRLAAKTSNESLAQSASSTTNEDSEFHVPCFSMKKSSLLKDHKFHY